jgi:Fur family ferric uptake transcriptional regulator
MPSKKLKEETELFYAYLRQNGLKKTYQKDLILETFLNTEGHLSVEDIYSLVKKKDRKVGVVTVFRTLKSLTACGIAREIALGDGLTRFEHSYHHPHHHHIVCTECHKAIEFVSPELERIQKEIIQKYHFQSINHRFQTYGICEDCREHRPVPEMQKQDTGKIFARDALKLAICVTMQGIDFCRTAAARNTDSGGQEILERTAQEEEVHLNELKAELEELNRQEKGLERVPIFLHFDPCELERLIPDLQAYEVGGQLNLDMKSCLEKAMLLKQRATGFFRDFADKFIETQGKKVFQRLADNELRRCEAISRRMEELIPVASTR